MTVLYWYWRRVYGNRLRYIADASQAAAFLRMTGRQTLRDGDIAALRALGVDAVADPGSDPQYAVADPLADRPE